MIHYTLIIILMLLCTLRTTFTQEDLTSRIREILKNVSNGTEDVYFYGNDEEDGSSIKEANVNDKDDELEMKYEDYIELEKRYAMMNEQLNNTKENDLNSSETNTNTQNENSYDGIRSDQNVQDSSSDTDASSFIKQKSMNMLSGLFAANEKIEEDRSPESNKITTKNRYRKHKTRVIKELNKKSNNRKRPNQRRQSYGLNNLRLRPCIGNGKFCRDPLYYMKKGNVKEKNRLSQRLRYNLTHFERNKELRAHDKLKPKIIRPKFLRLERVNDDVKFSVVDEKVANKLMQQKDIVFHPDLINKEVIKSPKQYNEINGFLSQVESFRNDTDSFQQFLDNILALNKEKSVGRSVKNIREAYDSAANYFALSKLGMKAYLQKHKH